MVIFNDIFTYAPNHLYYISVHLCLQCLRRLNQGRTGGDFKLSLDAGFCYQHDVRYESQSSERVIISLHNNENTELTGSSTLTTGMVLELELKGSKQVTLKRRMWDAAEPVFAQSQGSYQALANSGHVLQGHGSTPKIEEYDETGAAVMRARLGTIISCNCTSRIIIRGLAGRRRSRMWMFAHLVMTMRRPLRCM